MKPITLGMQKLVRAEQRSCRNQKFGNSAAKKQKTRKKVDSGPVFCDTIEHVQRRKLMNGRGALFV